MGFVWGMRLVILEQRRWYPVKQKVLFYKGRVPFGAKKEVGSIDDARQ